jgi:hypothetical protein
MHADLTSRVLPVSVVLLLLTVTLVLCGCTTAHITSTPSGADVFLGVGHNVTGQAVWEKRCKTPCMIRLGNSFHSLKVQWPDNVESNTQDADTAFPFFQRLDFHFVKPDLPVEQQKHIEWFAPVPFLATPVPEACQE